MNIKNKKKIYLITFHRAQSYGAFLQAFALQKCKELNPYDPVYIDYYPERFRYKKYVLNFNGKSLFEKIVKIPFAFILKTRMHLCIQRYVKKYLNITKKTYYKENELSLIKDDAEIFICGSDQIWDCRYDSIEKVLPYYLNFTNKKKYSYASSCGEMKYFNNRINKKYIEVLKELKSFKGITVREQYSADDLNLCDSSYKAVMMLDPTFLLNKKEWCSYLDSTKKIERFVLVYGLYRNSKLKEYASNLAKKKNIKIVNISDMLDLMSNADNIINVTPFKLLELIRDAEDVVTDSFHGCALSLNFNKELHIFMPLTSKIRIKSLVELFKLQNRVLENDLTPLNNEMNYIYINEILKKERKRSKDYLSNIVGDNIEQ